MVDKNIKLGELRVALDPKRPRNQQSVLTRFTYDVDGLLQVEVIEDATGKRHELILEQNPGLLGRDEIAQRLQALSELKVHPRDQQQNLALMARTERVYEEYIDARSMVQQWLAQFREVLESQDLQRIERHREELAQALDELEARA
jgi:molecular chaperone HscC